MAICSSCGAENRPGRRFCGQCGAALGTACAACGADNDPGDRFCGSCGNALSGDPPRPEGKLSQRRLVTVLFADLVGFTTLSEHRDPEEVRDLLGRYFDRCRSLIERYGGTVEKFIGDAVMAVWGAPVAREDDSVRAVRAALSLAGAVPLLGEELGMPELRLRAGVLTGHAAVEVGSDGEGMVIGDTVNTASRLQSIAQPGTVLVDDVTRRASEAAVEYEDAGEHTVKGRDQPVRAWRAMQVVAGAGGRRAVGLEAPFVGRDRELARIVDAAEASAADEQAALVAVVGEAGAGKSRLLWEYEKYMDGVQRSVLWHQGRCVSYGDGVAYWALAEMVRARAGILEDEPPASAQVKLRATVERYVTDERERRLVMPRLAHLLGLEQRAAADRVDLFSGWRLFFERLADQRPVVLVFEDLQWADSGLLDFIDHLLEWSAERPIFILACGRPEILDARPAWAGGAVVLDHLDERILRDLLSGLVPGLPEELTARVLAQADGVPLYAIETVRMLLDRGLLVQDGPRYVPTGDVSELDVPETLQALAAARLDGLSVIERAVLQDAAVLGQSFSAAGLAALEQRSASEIERTVSALVVKQLIAPDDDPLSPEPDQYHFLQGLIRATAYATLSRRDRKARHLAAARYLQEMSEDGASELAEVLAAHFLEAAAADPDASDAPRIRAAACETLEDAGRRALSLALGAEAMRAFDRASELAQDDLTRARLLDQAGQAALLNDDLDETGRRLTQAISIFDALGEHEAAGRAKVDYARLLHRQDRNSDAIRMLHEALPDLGADTEVRAAALAELAYRHAFAGEYEQSLAAADACLAIAETQQLWRTIIRAFDAHAFVRAHQGQLEEARAFRERALAIGLAHDVNREILPVFNNVADLALQDDRYREALDYAERGHRSARALGDRRLEADSAVMILAARMPLGIWDEPDPPGVASAGLLAGALLLIRARTLAARGETDALRALLSEAKALPDLRQSEYAAAAGIARAIALRALGDHRAALELALPVALAPDTINEDRREALVEAGLAALELGEEGTVTQLIAVIEQRPPASRSPVLRSGAARLAGLLALRGGDHATADERLFAAVRALDGIEAPFVLAQLLLERAELRLALGRRADAAPLATEASAIFERLRATPWVQRARALPLALVSA